MAEVLYIGNINYRPHSSVRVYPYVDLLAKFDGGYVVHEPLLDAEAVIASDSEAGRMVERAVRDQVEERYLRAYLTPIIAAAFPPQHLFLALGRAHQTAVDQAQEDGKEDLRASIRNLLDLCN